VSGRPFRRPRAGSRLPLDWSTDPQWDVGPEARDLLTRLLTTSADYRTDGDIGVGTLKAQAAAASAGSPVGRIVDRLVGAGLLKVHADGTANIPIEVFAFFNLTDAEVTELQSKKSRAGVEGGLATAARTRLLRGPNGRIAGTARVDATEARTEAPTEADDSVGDSVHRGTRRNTRRGINGSTHRTRPPSSVGRARESGDDVAHRERADRAMEIRT
jgi:hypothetical protein